MVSLFLLADHEICFSNSSDVVSQIMQYITQNLTKITYKIECNYQTTESLKNSSVLSVNTENISQYLNNHTTETPFGNVTTVWNSTSNIYNITDIVNMLNNTSTSNAIVHNVTSFVNSTASSGYVSSEALEQSTNISSENVTGTDTNSTLPYTTSTEEEQCQNVSVVEFEYEGWCFVLNNIESIYVLATCLPDGMLAKVNSTDIQALIQGNKDGNIHLCIK